MWEIHYGACCSALAVRKHRWVLDTLGHTLLRHAAGTDGTNISFEKSQPQRPKFPFKKELFKSVAHYVAMGLHFDVELDSGA